MTWITVVFMLLGTTLIQGGILKETGSSRDHRIVNGEPANPGEFPSQLSVQRNGRHECGASILNEEWVLTAAHCVDMVDPNIISFLAGTIDLKNGGTRHNATEIIEHEKFNMSAGYNDDIAVIKVSPPFDIDGVNVKAVTLPADGETPADDSAAIVVGWGINENFTIPDILQKVENYIVNQDTCKHEYARLVEILDSMICAGDPEVKGPCSADSGGPLFVNGTIEGLVSFDTPECADPKYATVYTRVSSYIAWIKEKTGV